LYKGKKKKKYLDFSAPVEISAQEGDGSVSCDFSSLSHSASCSDLFLNRFSKDDIIDHFDRIGLSGHLASLGFSPIVLEIKRDNTDVHFLAVYHAKYNPENLLIDLRIRESNFYPEKKLLKIIPLTILFIEWLSATNPRSQFTERKPRLPGQEKPGLGIVPFYLRLLDDIGSETHKDGCMDIPDHFHAACMYSKKFKFFNPSFEGHLRAILRDLGHYSISELSWGISTRTIINTKTRAPYEYTPSEQIFPISHQLQEYYSGKSYRSAVEEVLEKTSYFFDYEAMQTRKKEQIKKVKLRVQ
jgi:hypothetical protein